MSELPSRSVGVRLQEVHVMTVSTPIKEDEPSRLGVQVHDTRKTWTAPAFVKLRTEEAENGKGSKPSDGSKNS